MLHFNVPDSCIYSFTPKFSHFTPSLLHFLCSFVHCSVLAIRSTPNSRPATIYPLSENLYQDKQLKKNTNPSLGSNLIVIIRGDRLEFDGWRMKSRRLPGGWSGDQCVTGRRVTSERCSSACSCSHVRPTPRVPTAHSPGETRARSPVIRNVAPLLWGLNTKVYETQHNVFVYFKVSNEMLSMSTLVRRSVQQSDVIARR